MLAYIMTLYFFMFTNKGGFMFQLENDLIQYNVNKELVKKAFFISKSNYKKIELLSKKHYKSKSYILDLILDKVKI